MRHHQRGRISPAHVRLLPHNAVYPIRGQDAKRPRKLQRGQVHRVCYVHHVRHLDSLRAHLLQKRPEGGHNVHVRHTKRVGRVGVPVSAQAVYNHAEAREE